MDPIKTGMIISEARKKLNITQQELADKLHITDKAVSKWERGICCPDISVLIPLTEILNISLYDLLRGKTNNKNELETTLKSTINYSNNEINKKKKKYIIVSLVCIFITFIISITLICINKSEASGLSDRDTLYEITYYDKYINESNIDNIILELPLKWKRTNYKLDESVLTIFYDTTFDNLVKAYVEDKRYVKEAIIYNATIIFATTKDIDSVIFTFSDNYILVNKNELLKQYKMEDFSEIKNNWDSIFKNMKKDKFVNNTFDSFTFEK